MLPFCFSGSHKPIELSPLPNQNNLLGLSSHFMANLYFPLLLLLLLPLFSWPPCFSNGQASDLKLPLKAVNLGNWLIIEGWMDPTIFDGIPNNDLLDGTQVQFLSVKLQTFVTVENGGGGKLVANRTSASGWETFRLWRVDESHFNLRVSNKQFLTSGNQGLTADSNVVGDSQIFQILRNKEDPNRVRIGAPNGLFLQAQTEQTVTADYGGTSSWADDDPSVFKMTIVSTMRGEYQLTNGYGPKEAPRVMKEHRSTYIVEDDFKFISSHNLTAVRIPVGWWIALDPNPPQPFVGGSLEALDNAFTWAEKHGLKVIVDLHAVEGSQNGNDHSAARDGYIEWGDHYIPDTVAVIDILANRYANRPSLAAIELMNEPNAGGISLESLTKYYQLGYNAVRNHTSNAYVIFSNRLGGGVDPKELVSFASGLPGSVIDVHYYNLYSDYFKTLTVQQNIDFINNQRASDLSKVTTSNGALSFVGEWVAEFDMNGASMADYQNYAKAQIDVYGRATFGWAYWAYKCRFDHWSMQWMLQNNYILL